MTRHFKLLGGVYDIINTHTSFGISRLDFSNIKGTVDNVETLRSLRAGSPREKNGEKARSKGDMHVQKVSGRLKNRQSVLSSINAMVFYSN